MLTYGHHPLRDDFGRRHSKGYPAASVPLRLSGCRTQLADGNIVTQEAQDGSAIPTRTKDGDCSEARANRWRHASSTSFSTTCDFGE